MSLDNSALDHFGTEGGLSGGARLGGSFSEPAALPRQTALLRTAAGNRADRLLAHGSAVMQSSGVAILLFMFDDAIVE